MAASERTRTHFRELIQFKAPDGFSLAVATAARLDHMTISEFLRRTVIARLREVGLSIERTPDAVPTDHQRGAQA